MKKFNKVIALVLAVLFVAASFAACSSNSGKDDKGTTEAAKTQKVKVIDIALLTRNTPLAWTKSSRS